MSINTKNINGLSNDHYIEISELEYEKLRIFLKLKSKQLGITEILEPNDFVYGIKYLDDEKEKTYYLIFYQKKDTKQLQEFWPNEHSINPNTTKIINKEEKKEYKLEDDGDIKEIKNEEENKDINSDIAESINKNPTIVKKKEEKEEKE